MLIVDDNVDAAELLASLLQLSGHRCLVSHDGLSALQVFAEEQPEVVILDIGLPGMDGFEVAKKIRQTMEGRRVVLIALTGYGHGDIVERALGNGFDHHLLKPADPVVIERLLAGDPGDTVGHA